MADFIAWEQYDNLKHQLAVIQMERDLYRSLLEEIANKHRSTRIMIRRVLGQSIVRVPSWKCPPVSP